MPVVNPLSRELVFKIVYYGPGLGGKTTTLQHIHATTKAEHRGKMVSLATPVDRTLYFDFLPIRLPTARGMGLRLQLFTVPGQVYYNATRRLVLTGADGIVFVADSQRARLDANLESLANLNDNLREHGRQLQDVPHAIAYNKRDLYDVVSIEELERQLDRHGAPSFATCATQGEGVYETLDAIARAVLDDFERKNPEGREVVARELEVPEGGLTAALRGVEKAAARAEADIPRAAIRRPSGVLSMEELPGAVGEDAARVVSPSVVSRVAPALILTPAASEPRAEPSAAEAPSVVAQAHEFADSGTLPEPSGPEPSIQEDTTERVGVSFQALWPEAEQGSVSELESALGDGRFADAVKLADELVSRALAGVGGTLAAGGDAPRDPALVVTLLGLDGRGYLAFRSLVREARSGQGVGEVGALSAFAFAIAARLARARLG